MRIRIYKEECEMGNWHVQIIHKNPALVHFTTGERALAWVNLYLTPEADCSYLPR